MDIAALKKNPLATLSGMLRTRVDKKPVWLTPNPWADSEGLFANDAEGWLYRELPSSMLRDTDTLNDALLRLAQQLPGRQVQILMHTWEHLGDPHPSTPAALAQFQRDSMRFLVPTRAASIGVQLVAAPHGKVSVLDHVFGAVDDLLGESVPDLSAYDADRQVVGSALEALGATALTRAVSNFIEAWYALGVVSDLEAVERDEMVMLEPGVRLEFATAGPLSGERREGQMPSANERGATVLSVRGTLTVQPATAQSPVRGVLMRASVIYGRRAEHTRAPLVVSLRDLPNVSPRPLPTRQLAALHETLPCSNKRLAPDHQRLGGAELRAFGFGDPKAPGAEAGLLLGTGGRAMARPVHVDPTAGTGLGVVVADEGAGKTFLCEVLATQAKLAGFRTVYLSGTPDAGQGFSTLTGATTWAPSAAGDLDPFRWVAAGEALDLYGDLITGFQDILDGEEAAGLATGFFRARQVGAADFTTVMRLSDSNTGVAKVMRALRRHTSSPVLDQSAGGGPGHLPDAIRIDLSATTADVPVAALGAAQVMLHVARTSAAPTLVVIDDLAAALTHPALVRALAVAAAAPHVAVLVTAPAGAELPAALAGADHRYVLSTTDEGAVRLVGENPSAALMHWMLEARAELADGVVVLPAGGLYRGPSGTVSGFQLGPWPAQATPALTRGAASSYART